MKCPECQREMLPGYMPVDQGLYWFKKGVAPKVDVTAEYLPGTSTILRYARIEAHHCLDCSLVTFRYGRPLREDEDDAPL